MWYFYLINVIENLNVFCACFDVFVGFALIMTLVAFFMTLDDRNDEKINKIIKKLLKICIPIYIVFIIITVLSPNKETMYLVAGAKATEMLAATPEASKARQVIDLGLDKILVELKK